MPSHRMPWTLPVGLRGRDYYLMDADPESVDQFRTHWLASHPGAGGIDVRRTTADQSLVAVESPSWRSRMVLAGFRLCFSFVACTLGIGTLLLSTPLKYSLDQQQQWQFYSVLREMPAYYVYFPTLYLTCIALLPVLFVLDPRHHVGLVWHPFAEEIRESNIGIRPLSIGSDRLLNDYEYALCFVALLAPYAIGIYLGTPMVTYDPACPRLLCAPLLISGAMNVVLLSILESFRQRLSVAFIEHSYYKYLSIYATYNVLVLMFMNVFLLWFFLYLYQYSFIFFEFEFLYSDQLNLTVGYFDFHAGKISTILSMIIFSASYIFIILGFISKDTFHISSFNRVISSDRSNRSKLLIILNWLTLLCVNTMAAWITILCIRIISGWELRSLNETLSFGSEMLGYQHLVDYMLGWYILTGYWYPNTEYIWRLVLLALYAPSIAWVGAWVYSCGQSLVAAYVVAKSARAKVPYSHVDQLVSTLAKQLGVRPPMVWVDERSDGWAETIALLPWPQFCVVRVSAALVDELSARDSSDQQLTAVLGHELMHCKLHSWALWLSQVLSRVTLIGPGYLSLLFDCRAMELEADIRAAGSLGCAGGLRQVLQDGKQINLRVKWRARRWGSREAGRVALPMGRLAFWGADPGSGKEPPNRRKLGDHLRAVYALYFGERLWGYFHPDADERLRGLGEAWTPEDGDVTQRPSGALAGTAQRRG